MRLGVVEADLRDALARERHGQADELALHVGRDLERHRLGIVLRDRERRAVGQDAAGAADAEAADREQALVESELEEAPAVRPGAAQAHVDRVFDVTRFLLKVMRQQEHALRPDDLAVQTHEAAWSTLELERPAFDAELAGQLRQRDMTFCGWAGWIATTLRHLACSRSRYAATTPRKRVSGERLGEGLGLARREHEFLLGEKIGGELGLVALIERHEIGGVEGGADFSS